MSIDESTVLLVDDREPRSRQLHSILEFLDIEQVRVATHHDWRSVERDEMLHIVLLGGGNAPCRPHRERPRHKKSL